MCVSRLHRVVSVDPAGLVLAEDMDGAVHHVSILALDGSPPEPGEWLVVHSGYAVDRADHRDAEAVRAELRRSEHLRGGSS